MQPMQHQMMGYDRAITMFSPDGRLLQVEYAKKTVRLGNTAIGVACKDGVVLVTDKRIASKLVVADAIEKIFVVDDHMIATAAGIMSDARVLVERSREKAQSYRVTYDSPIDVLTIVKDLADLKQFCTQSGGLRPFGVSMLVAGVDETGRRLYQTDPTGLFYEHKAVVIGEGEEIVEPILQEEYKDSITVDEGLQLAIKALKKAVGEGFSAERVDAIIVDEKATMKHFSTEDIKKYL